MPLLCHKLTNIDLTTFYKIKHDSGAKSRAGNIRGGVCGPCTSLCGAQFYPRFVQAIRVCVKVVFFLNYHCSVTFTGYNVFTDSEQLSTNFKANVGCDGGTGSSVVFSARTLSASGCNNIPSDPLELTTTCGHNQTHQAVQLAFQDRSSFSLGFSVLCEGNQCGSECVGTRLSIHF